jgi:hypothetical protein
MRETATRATAPPCGCKSGAAFAVTALVAWPIWTVASGPPNTPIEALSAIGGYAVVVVGAGIVGKVGGIAVGRRRLATSRR